MFEDDTLLEKNIIQKLLFYGSVIFLNVANPKTSIFRGFTEIHRV